MGGKRNGAGTSDCLTRDKRSGTTHAAAVPIPDRSAVEGLGQHVRVQWQTNGGDQRDGNVQSPGIGVSFYCLEPEAKAMLADFCEVREPLYYANVTESGEFERVGMPDVA